MSSTKSQVQFKLFFDMIALDSENFRGRRSMNGQFN